MNSSWLTSLYARGASRTRVGSAVNRSHCISNLRTACDRWLGAAIGLVAPPSCAACGLEDEPWGGLKSVMPHLCHTCQDAISPPNDNRCLRCGASVGPFIDARRDCIYCRGDRFHFETVIRLGIYSEALRSMCLAAKRPRSEELAAALAGFLWQREEWSLRGARAQLIVPVPHHWTESVRRTPHAPETLATVLSRRLRVKMATHILAKTRRTDKQSELPQSRRRTNLKGAFHVPRRYHSDLEGRRILLVDDVLTTGATANEVAQALLAANASSVTVTVIARALGKKSVSGPPG